MNPAPTIASVASASRSIARALTEMSDPFVVVTIPSGAESLAKAKDGARSKAWMAAEPP